MQSELYLELAEYDNTVTTEKIKLMTMAEINREIKKYKGTEQDNCKKWENGNENRREKRKNSD